MHEINLLEIGQFIMLGLAALVSMKTQWLVLMRKASEHPQVHELIIANMDLDEVVCSCHQLSFELHCSEHIKGFPFFLF